MSQEKLSSFLKNELNPEQRKAVTQRDGIFLVLAGAGSGKTRVITARILHLIINEQIDPSTILALTFTNKAAKEMKERVDTFLPDMPIAPFIGTFHSYCLYLLRTYKNVLQIDSFSILDQDDKKLLLTNLIKKNNLEKRISARNLSYFISQHKNNRALSSSTIGQNLLMEDLYHAYEKEKTVSKCLDFDDLLLEVHKYLKTHKEFHALHQKYIRHLLVDEYQDTNIVQHSLLKYMTLSEKKFSSDSLCVVGDEDQSIYSWRGAVVSNILNFKKDFPKTKTIKIEQNYRSVQPILHAANHIIKNNIHRNPKKLWSEKKASDRIRVITCLSGFQEGEVIATYIKTVMKNSIHKNIALLYRAHYQSRTIEEALIRHSVPYKIISGIQFYERKEIKDILAYLRLISNPFDRISFMRIINCPNRGLGPKFQEELFETWNQEPLWNFQDLLKSYFETCNPNTKRYAIIKQFLSAFDRFSHTDPASDAIEHIIKKIDYFDYLKHAFDAQDAESKIQNVKELIRAAKYFEDAGINTISAFLNEVTLMQEKTHAKDTDETPVQLMTLHAAKGLEFDTVILNGLEEGIFPSSQTLQEPDRLEEERRLFYVGITRAKERLLITHSRFRYTYGQMTDQLPSQFLDELPEHYIKSEDMSHRNMIQLQTYFNEWLGIKKEQTVFTFPAYPYNNQTVQTIRSQIKAKTDKKNVWKKNQLVKHEKFGMGYITLIEDKGTRGTFLTVQFGKSKKKIKDTFVTIV